MYRTIPLLIAVLMLVCSCQSMNRAESNAREAGIELTSSAFRDGSAIPLKYSRNGDNFSPPLAWNPAPKGTQSFALITDDPDAPSGTWVHWVIFDLPAGARRLSEHVPAERTLPDGTRQGTNDFRNVGYDGPSPPSGTHRYYFKLYALDTRLDLPPGATKAQLLGAMKGHALAQGQLVGKFTRQR